MSIKEHIAIYIGEVLPRRGRASSTVSCSELSLR